jgi:3-hydroxyacyl-CoA dehydrogenase
MKSQQNSEDPWQYATYEGVERLQFQQTARMTLSERLQALDEMISLARALHGCDLVVNEPPENYEVKGE